LTDIAEADNAVVGDSGESVIAAEPGDEITVRMATPDECGALGLVWWGKLIWVLTHPDGTETIRPADGVTVRLLGNNVDEDPRV
jgi:hypothetical protein